MTNPQTLSEPIVNEQLALQHGLTSDEYRKILEILGRIPTYTELGIFSVMWSEHCSYKNSILMLKTLPRSGARLLVGAGEENAGLVDIGDGLAVAFKIESHNHPSAVEPYQGAATGVGGIMRDIFTMGARPIAALNSLRFGKLNDQRSKMLFKHVVKGIGDYGNSFGVPTVAGEVYFDDCYRDNPLVNAMAVGIVEKDKVAKAVAHGIGNIVMIVGSATGKDGIHGATFASEEISNESEAKRPAVQVGDPFMEKLLLEATLEAIQEGLVIGIQDMGAAGLTCSSTEMSAKGKSGMKLYLERVPLREKGMNSYEIMLSESQERMLLVAKKEDEEKLLKIFKKWDLSASTIGEVTDNHIVEVYHHGALKASVPAYSLVLGEGAPVYQREAVEPTYLKEVRSFDGRTITEPRDYTETFLSLLQSPIIGSKRWVFEQYDHMVRTNTVIEPGSSDAAIIRIKGTDKALALKTDCNSRYVYLHPRRGGEIAVAEATRNVVCSGAKPLAITNCLNFGNPYDPEIYWQFREAVLGIGTACRVLETPVTGGNVSFYNEGPTAAVYPTPVIGMLGLVESLEHVMTSYFKDSGDLIILLGKPTGEIGGSEYLFQRTGKLIGDAPSIDLMYEKLLQEFCLTLIHRGLIKSAHDVSEGGLIVSLFESCLNPFQLLGIRVEGVPIDGLRSDFALFGESQGMIIVSASSHHAKHVIDAARSVKVPAYVIGEVTTDGRFSVEGLFDVELEVARNLYEKAIPKAIGEERA